MGDFYIKILRITGNKIKINGTPPPKPTPYGSSGN